MERRLDTLKKGRLMAAYRADRVAEKEARRLERASCTSINRYEDEAKRIAREERAFYAIPNNPVNADNEVLSREHESPENAFESVAGDQNECTTQVLSWEGDADVLRNGQAAVERMDQAEPELDRNHATIDPLAENSTHSDDARAKVARQLHRVRDLDWRNPAEVRPDDVMLLKKLRMMPPSIAREALVRLTFGSEPALRNAWRNYDAWSEEKIGTT